MARLRGGTTTGLIAAVIWLAAAEAQADRLVMTNGDRLSGTLVSLDQGQVRFAAQSAGEVAVPAASVATIATDGVVTVRFTDGTLVTGRLVEAGPARMQLVETRVGRTPPFGVAEIAAARPGRGRPGALDWSGRVNLGANHSTGNTRITTLHLDGEARARGARDRITGFAEANWSRDDGEVSARNARAELKHDHFLNAAWYAYTNGSVEHDQLKDLRLRTTIGTGAGYQVFDTPLRSLSIEAGPSYLNEDFEDGEDRSAIAARWGIDFEQAVFGGAARLFHNQVGLWNLLDTAEVIIRTRSGVRVALRERLEATARIDLDWHSTPAPGQKKFDTTYLLTLGYRW